MTIASREPVAEYIAVRSCHVARVRKPATIRLLDRGRRIGVIALRASRAVAGAWPVYGTVKIGLARAIPGAARAVITAQRAAGVADALVAAIRSKIMHITKALVGVRWSSWQLAGAVAAACDVRITERGAVPGRPVVRCALTAIVARDAAETARYIAIAFAVTVRHVAYAVCSAARQAVAIAESWRSIPVYAVITKRSVPANFAYAFAGRRTLRRTYSATAARPVAVRLGYGSIREISDGTIAIAVRIARTSDTVATRRRKR